MLDKDRGLHFETSASISCDRIGHALRTGVCTGHIGRASNHHRLRVAPSKRWRIQPIGCQLFRSIRNVLEGRALRASQHPPRGCCRRHACCVSGLWRSVRLLAWRDWQDRGSVRQHDRRAHVVAVTLASESLSGEQAVGPSTARYPSQSARL